MLNVDNDVECSLFSQIQSKYFICKFFIILIVDFYLTSL